MSYRLEELRKCMACDPVRAFRATASTELHNARGHLHKTRAESDKRYILAQARTSLLLPTYPLHPRDASCVLQLYLSQARPS
jgi:hypothetical protein